MPLPLAIGAGAKVAGSYLSKLMLKLLGAKVMGMGVKGAAKAAYHTKGFWPAATIGGFGAMTAMSERGRAKERGATAEGLDIQRLIAESQIEAQKLALTGSRKSTKEYTEQLMKMKREDRAETRDLAAMAAFTQSQDRQMALLMQAVQAMSARPGGGNPQAPRSNGMLGLMRGGS